MTRFRRWLMPLSLIAAALPGARAAFADSVIRFVPQADINVLDPVVNHSPVVTQYAFMIYDQLFGIDGKYRPHPQMVDTYTMSPDGKSYRFTLRSGLKFSDGAPVRAADAVASITRWAKNDPAGDKMMKSGMTLAAVDDRTFTMTFDKPFGTAVDVMAKPSWPLFVMPERDAQKPITEPVTDAVGSGPFLFDRADWKPGNKLVFTKNPDYVPRSEPADGYSGGKVVKVDRVEWDIIKDPQTALSALQRGEVDAVENVPIDLAKTLKTDPNITVAIFNKVGLQAYLRFNNVVPPFNNPKARQALLYLVNQQDYMRAAIGDPAYWQVCWAYMMCNSPNGSEAGTQAFRKPDLAKAKALLKEAGYNGEKVVILGSTGIFAIPEETQVLVAELKSIGVNVDDQEMEFNAMLSRRNTTATTDKGGWNIIPLWSFGPDLANPLTSQMMTAPCTLTGWPGWACDAKLEQLRDDWAAAPTPEKRREVDQQIQLEAVNLAATIPLGQFYQPLAYSKNLSGMLSAPYFVWWNVAKK